MASDQGLEHCSSASDQRGVFALENSLLREMIGIFTAAHILADVIDERDDFQDVINIYTSTRLFPTFGFSFWRGCACILS